MNKLTKVIRLEILKPVDTDWNTLGPKLRELQRLTANVLNFCIRNRYIETAVKYEDLIKKEEKVTRGKLEISKSLCKLIHNRYGECFSSYVRAQVDNIARQRWINDWYDVLVTGKKSLPSYRSDCPIYIAVINKYGIRIWENIEENGPNRYIGLKLFIDEESRIIETTLLFNNRAFDDSRRAIWDRLITGEYKLGMVQLIYSKRLRKWFANISYSFETKPVEELDPNIRVGVDLGLSVPVYLAVNNGFARAALREEGETIQSFRRQLERRRRRLRRNERGILDRRSGHGREHKIESIEKLRKLENDFRRTANHRLSRGVVNFAQKNYAGVIVMEDLTGFTYEHAEDKFLKTWTYFELQTMIEQKATEIGIKVEKVKPQYTSLRCSKCGYIDKDNRNGRQFNCISCGLSLHADYNAARNLATPDIESLIDKSVEEMKSGDEKMEV